MLFAATLILMLAAIAVLRPRCADGPSSSATGVHDRGAGLLGRGADRWRRSFNSIELPADHGLTLTVYTTTREREMDPR